MIKITLQYAAGGREQPVNRPFKSLDEARAFIMESLQNNAGVQSTYRIYDFDDLLETHDSNSVKNLQTTSDDSGAGQGQKSGATFRPSPLQMAPKPKGIPSNHWVDPDEDKDKQ
ncbi:MAG TPA: hypothetical protein VL360_02405 [Gammaproteobacteria bacterium]|jgi:hypothetical protein|nr:hypothetical protein [Gammaproteobacteria bacterium]